MRTVTFASSKGGTGKSTLAASLAVAAMQAGEKPHLIDMDPQLSLTAWHARRKLDDPPIDRIEKSLLLRGALSVLDQRGITLVIIDTAGVSSDRAKAAMEHSDLVMVPARASALDLEAARPTLAELYRLDRPNAFVLNAVAAGRNARNEDAGRALGLLGLLADPPIVQRADHVDAIGLGLGVTEFNPDGKAAAEIVMLWTWIKQRLEGQNVEKAVA